MSEYQYYEFLAVDRPLTKDEQAQVRALSTRAEITATRFVNEYHFGDFHGDTTKMVEQFYDAHLYFANRGSRRLLLRLPSALLAKKEAEPYALEESLTVRTKGGHTLLDFSLSPEDAEEWDFESSFSLSEFVGLRAELAAGDLRPLYLAWLAGLRVWEPAEDDEEEYIRELEPQVPAGLGELTGAQRALTDFLQVDEDLLAVAVRASTPMEQPSPRAAPRHWPSTNGVPPRSERLTGASRRSCAASTRSASPARERRCAPSVRSRGPDRAYAAVSRAAAPRNLQRLNTWRGAVQRCGASTTLCRRCHPWVIGAGSPFVQSLR